jgi:hypothetical protein
MASIIFQGPARYCKKRRKPAERTPYTKRNEVLARLGFPSYREYLDSPLWQAIRSAKLEVDPNCELCDDPAGEVHHLDYTRGTLIGKNQHKLLSVCRCCHKDLEFRPDGTKKGFNAVRSKARRRLRKLGKWDQHKK